MLRCHSCGYCVTPMQLLLTHSPPFTAHPSSMRERAYHKLFIMIFTMFDPPWCAWARTGCLRRRTCFGKETVIGRPLCDVRPRTLVTQILLKQALYFLFMPTGLQHVRLHSSVQLVCAGNYNNHKYNKYCLLIIVHVPIMCLMWTCS